MAQKRDGVWDTDILKMWLHESYQHITYYFVNSGSTPLISLSEVTVCIVLDLIEHRQETAKDS
jgi:hypothetical protein